MKTYEGFGYRWFYDYHLRIWTIYKIDEDGNQIGFAEYYPKNRLLLNYPFTTKKHNPCNSLY